MVVVVDNESPTMLCYALLHMPSRAAAAGVCDGSVAMSSGECLLTAGMMRPLLLGLYRPSREEATAWPGPAFSSSRRAWTGSAVQAASGWWLTTVEGKRTGPAFPDAALPAESETKIEQKEQQWDQPQCCSHRHTGLVESLQEEEEEVEAKVQQ